MLRDSIPVLFLLGILAGCTTDEENDSPPADSTPATDAAPTMDEAMATDMTMMGARDMGTLTPDMQTGPEDQGPMTQDEGVRPADEGVPVTEDGGPMPEMGPVVVDMGAANVDMGSAGADMNPPAPDQGVQCTPVGDLMEEFPCCEGSTPIQCAEFARNHCVPCDELPSCLPCGNGVCDEGENVCNCDADCDFDVECFGNGQQVPNVEGAPGCCEGLEPIGCERAGPGGICEPCIGSTSCSPCGDGVCDPVENHCNCPADCQPARRCQATPQCLGRDSPLLCPGVWRCDPDELFEASERVADGCSFTCFMDLTVCHGNQDCFPGEACTACPEGTCNGSVCMDPDSL